MAMPFFTPGDDPGSNFPELLRRVGTGAPTPVDVGDHGCVPARHHVRGHALRRRRGDGRRPPGHARQPDQPPRRWRRSSRPTASAASPSPARPVRRWRWSSSSSCSSSTTRRSRARSLSLEGKANQLVDDGARQPAGGDAGDGRRADLRRLRPAPAAPGGCSTTTSPAAATRSSDYVATGSGSLHAGTVIKIGYRDAHRAATRPSTSRCQALLEAADEDSATGGPDLAARHLPDRRHDHRRRVRSASPTTSSPTARPSARRAPDRRSTRVRGPMSMPFYVAPEQVMKDRADYARKGIARGRGLVAVALRRRHRCSSPRTRRTRCARSARSTTASPSPASASTTSSTSCASPACAHADLKGYQYSRDDVDARSLANQYAQILGQVFTHEMKPMEVEILVAEVGDDRRRRPAVPHPLRRHRHGRARLQRARRRRRGHRRPARRVVRRRRSTLAAAVTAGIAALAGPDRTLGADDLEVAVLARSNGRRCFRRLTDADVAEILAS